MELVEALPVEGSWCKGGEWGESSQMPHHAFNKPTYARSWVTGVTMVANASRPESAAGQPAHVVVCGRRSKPPRPRIKPRCTRVLTCKPDPCTHWRHRLRTREGGGAGG